MDLGSSKAVIASIDGFSNGCNYLRLIYCA
jgi:hypothetical protein